MSYPKVTVEKSAVPKPNHNQIAVNMTLSNPEVQVLTYDTDILILQRYMLLEYMSDSTQEHSIASIEKFCTDRDIDKRDWSRWLKQRSFQSELAEKCKHSIYHGTGAAQAYQALEQALNNPVLRQTEKAKIAATIAKLHQKNLELYTRLRIAQLRRRGVEDTKNSLENLIEEIRNERGIKDVTARATVTEVQEAEVIEEETGTK